jgi:hypothetical protein
MYPIYMVRFNAPEQVIGTSRYSATKRNVMCEGTQSVRCCLEDDEIMAFCAGKAKGSLEVFKMIEGSLEFRAIPNSEIATIIRSGYKWERSDMMCKAVGKLEAI